MLLSVTASVMDHKIEFLVDSGAERSVLSRQFVPASLLYPSAVSLKGVGGETLNTYGQFSTKIGVRSLRREFPITFVVADVKPIIGADFLTRHGLLLNMKAKSLHDPLTSLSAKLNSTIGQVYAIHFSEVNS